MHKPLILLFIIKRETLFLVFISVFLQLVFEACKNSEEIKCLPEMFKYCVYHNSI